MTTSLNNRATRSIRRPRAGFTLVEVMISAGLAGAVLVAVLTSFLMIGRSGAVLYNYIGMEEEARRGLEKFGQDTRMASGLTWTTDGSGKIISVSLTVPHVNTSDSYSNTVV